MAVSRPNIVSRIGRIPAGNHGGPRPARPTHITDHHIVGDANAAIGRFEQAGQEASSTFIIGSDGTIYQELDIMTIPYTDSNIVSNRRAITIEHAGGHPNVPYTEAMYKSAIHLHAWLREQYGIPVENEYQHKQVTRPENPTACAGGLDTDRIKREATAMINSGGNMPTLIDEEGVRILAVAALGRPEPLTTTQDLRYHIGGDALKKIKEFWYSPEGKAWNAYRQSLPQKFAESNALIESLRKQIDELDDRATPEQTEALKKAAADAVAQAQQAREDLDKLILEKQEDEKTGNSFLRWLGDQLNKLLGKG